MVQPSQQQQSSYEAPGIEVPAFAGWSTISAVQFTVNRNSDLKGHGFSRAVRRHLLMTRADFSPRGSCPLCKVLRFLTTDNWRLAAGNRLRLHRLRELLGIRLLHRAHSGAQLEAV